MQTSDTDSRDAIRARFLSVDTSNVADVLDKLGCPDQGLRLTSRPIRVRPPVSPGGLIRFVGK